MSLWTFVLRSTSKCILFRSVVIDCGYAMPLLEAQSDPVDTPCCRWEGFASGELVGPYLVARQMIMGFGNHIARQNDVGALTCFWLRVPYTRHNCLILRCAGRRDQVNTPTAYQHRTRVLEVVERAVERAKNGKVALWSTRKRARRTTRETSAAYLTGCNIPNRVQRPCDREERCGSSLIYPFRRVYCYVYLLLL